MRGRRVLLPNASGTQNGEQTIRLARFRSIALLDAEGRFATRSPACLTLGSILLLLFAYAAPAMAARGGTTVLALSIEQRTFDTMSISESRPSSKGEVGGVLDLQYFANGWIAATIGGRIGGSWFDFSGPSVVGNVQESSWGIRAGVDGVLGGDSQWQVLLGLGLTYGEARSWLENALAKDEGPRVFMPGGDLRVRATYMPASRIGVAGTLQQGFYKAHARRGAFENDFNWLGRSFSTSVGVVYVLFGAAND